MTASRRYGVIGAGRLGSALAEALAGAGRQVARVASRSPKAAESLARRLPEARACDAPALVHACDAVMLAVPDDALATLAASLPWRPGQAAVAVSGALGLDVLEPARRAGARAGCLHPLQSFPEREGGAKRFVGVVCGVEGDPPLGDELAELCQALGARSVRLEGVDRARYHAAAVLASNYVVALHAAAAEVWRAAGLPPELARPALAPLTRGVVDAIERLALPQALTGPLLRGDVETVALHLSRLTDLPEQQRLYRILGLQLLALPLGLPPERAEALRRLLEDS